MLQSMGSQRVGHDLAPEQQLIFQSLLVIILLLLIAQNLSSNGTLKNLEDG